MSLSRFTIYNVQFLLSTANERVVIDVSVNGKSPGWIPDGRGKKFRAYVAKYIILLFLFIGMTIDTDGNLYVATWGGSKVVKINPE